MHPAFHTHADAAVPLVLVTARGLGPWTKEQPDRVKRLVDAAGFRGDAGKVLLLHGDDGSLASVLAGLGEGMDGLVLASLAASVRAAATQSSATSQIIPQSLACWAGSLSPVMARAMARAMPTRWGSSQLLPASGISPILLKA